MMNPTGEVGRICIERPYCERSCDQPKTERSWQRDNHPVATLNERGLIMDCNESFETLFEFSWSGLIWRHVSLLFPHLLANDFVLAGDAHPMRDYLIRCGQQHLAQNRHGDRFHCNLIFVRTVQEGACCLKMTVVPCGDGQS